MNGTELTKNYEYIHSAWYSKQVVHRKQLLFMSKHRITHRGVHVFDYFRTRVALIVDIFHQTLNKKITYSTYHGTFGSTARSIRSRQAQLQYLLLQAKREAKERGSNYFVIAGDFNAKPEDVSQCLLKNI